MCVCVCTHVLCIYVCLCVSTCSYMNQIYISYTFLFNLSDFVFIQITHSPPPHGLSCKRTAQPSEWGGSLSPLSGVGFLLFVQTASGFLISLCFSCGYGLKVFASFFLFLCSEIRFSSLDSHGPSTRTLSPLGRTH